MKIKPQHQKQRSSLTKHSPISSMNTSMIKIQKQQTKHPKPLTNTVSSTVNSVAKKYIKQKKPQLQQDKKQKTIRQTELMTSGRSKPLKQKIKNKKSCDFSLTNFFQLMPEASSGAVSYREYCLVEDSFVPIVSKNEHKKLQDIMRSTADTTIRCDELNRSTFRNVFGFRLKEKSQESFTKVQRLEKEKEYQNEEEEDGRLFLRSKKVSKREVEISASPFYEQVGIQYSERPEVMKPIVELIKEKRVAQIDIQTDDELPICNPVIISPVKLLDQVIYQSEQAQQQQSQEQPLQQYKNDHQVQIQQPAPQTLSDLLLKLQFAHLPNQTSFTTLSKTQKQHYSQLLTSLISKLNCSPRHQKSPRQIKTKQQIEIQEVRLIPVEEIKIKHERLEMEVFKRESCQMNWMQRRMGQKEGECDTSMMAVNSFLLNFFCYIELNYIDDFLNNIKKQYGPSYSTEFQRVTRKLTNLPTPGKVLPQRTFQQFSQQLDDLTLHQQSHLHAIFDTINQLLDTYRPYYQHHGQPFPWAVKMYNNICQYVIDESSLEIIFVEVKQNIERSCAMLCGLIVDEGLLKDAGDVNPLTAKREQKEDAMVEGWLGERGDENHEMECEATIVLNQMSEEVYDLLLREVLEEMRLLGTKR